MILDRLFFSAGTLLTGSLSVGYIVQAAEIVAHRNEFYDEKHPILSVALPILCFLGKIILSTAMLECAFNFGKVAVLSVALSEGSLFFLGLGVTGWILTYTCSYIYKKILPENASIMAKF